MDNIELLTLSELKEKYKELTEKFEIAQQSLKENYLTMVELSNQAIEIKKIINKRGGQI